MPMQKSKEHGADLTDSAVRAILVQAMADVGADPVLVYAFQRTGVYICEENENRLPQGSLKAFDGAVDEYFAALNLPPQWVGRKCPQDPGLRQNWVVGPPLTVFDVNGIPATRREWIEAAIALGGDAGTGIAFDVLLPKTVAGFPDLEKSLTIENLTGWLGNLTTRNVEVSLPKFRAESEFSLREGLSTMGMPTSFSDKADFSGIDPKRGLAISEVVHKAFVDVSEQGTEAAATTGITMRALAMRKPEQAVVFRADHPFVFVIRDTVTGVVLFIGRLMNPQ